MDCTFVYAQRNLAALKFAQLLDSLSDFLAQVQHSVRVFGKQHAGVGECSSAGAAHEERLAHPLFQLADGDADGGLCAVQLFCRTRKTALARYRLKDL